MIMRILLFLLFVIPFVAHAHGDAEWIKKNPATSYCCGPKDCVKIEGVKYSPQGWYFQNPHNGRTEQVLNGQEYHSIDDHYWACFVLFNDDKPLRCDQRNEKCCFFVPLPGV